MPSLNKVLLIGHVGRDPEMRYTQGGDAIANFSLATSERWTAKDGQKQERTEWHRVDVFGKPAKFVGDYVKKGALVLVEGSVRYEDWTDKDGNKRQGTKIRAQRVENLSPRAQDAEPAARPGVEITDADVPFSLLLAPLVPFVLGLLS